MKHLATMAAACAFALAVFHTSAQAQDVLVLAAGTPGGQSHRTATTLASSLSKAGGFNVQVQSYAGVEAWLPLVDNGEIDLGNLVLEEGMDALQGKGNFAGRKLENVKLVGSLFPTYLGLFVSADSPVKSVADLKGKSITYNYNAQPGITKNIDAILSTGGLSIADMQPVPVPSVTTGADAVSGGSAEVGYFALGAGKLIEVDNAIGGIRFVPLPEGEKTAEALKALVPSGYVTTVEPVDGVVGVRELTPMLTVDYVLVAGSHVSEEAVYNAVKTLHENIEALKADNPKFASFTGEFMARDIGVEMHPGALKYYREVGLISK